MSATKEPSFFSRGRERFVPPVSWWSEQFTHTEEEYLALFSLGAEKKVRGESSPVYLWSDLAPARIKLASPSAHIVILLRDPVERALSSYALDRRLGWETRPVDEAMRADDATFPKELGATHNYVEFGRYHDGVDRYLKTFGRAKVSIILFPRLRSDPRGVLRELASSLGVDPGPMNTLDVRAQNGTLAARGTWAERIFRSGAIRRAARRTVPRGLRRFVGDRVLYRASSPPTASAETLAWLREKFEPDLARLETRLGRKLPELRTSWPPSP